VQGVLISYEFVFDVGGPIDPTDLARKILQSDLGISAVNYATGLTEIAERFGQLVDLKADIRALREADAAGKAGSASSYLRWGLRHPAVFFRIVRRSWKNRAVNRDDIDGTSAAQLLDETDESIDESMAAIGWIESLQHHVDSQLYQPRYMAEVPFSRVSLQSFFASTKEREIAGDVSLLLHRSGTAILKFYVMVEEEVTVADVLELQMPSLVEVRSIDAPEAIWMHRMVESELEWSDLEKESRFSGGIKWVKLYGRGGETLTDFFVAYAEAVLRIAVGDHVDPWSRTVADGWHLYPVTFIRRLIPECHALEDLRSRRAVLGPLLLRMSDWENYRQDRLEELIDRELGRSADRFVHIGLGHAVVVYLEGVSADPRERFNRDVTGQEWLVHDFNTVTIVELLLLQRWILRGIDDQLRYRMLRPRDLAELRLRSIDALEEYHQIAPLAYGDAQNMVKEARITLGLEDHYAAVKMKLREIETLMLAHEAQVRGRRNRFLQAAIAVGTALLGFAGAWAVVDVLREWNHTGSLNRDTWIGRVVQSVAEFATSSPVAATLIIYGIVVGVLVLVLVWSLLPTGVNWRSRSFPASGSAKPGFSWPGPTIQWVSEEDPTTTHRTKNAE